MPSSADKVVGAPVPSAPREPSGAGALAKPDRSIYAVRAAGAALLLALLLAAHLTTPQFLTWDNMLTVLRTAAPVGIAAVGLAFITISGNYFSLSIEQTATLGAVIFGLSLQGGMGMPVAVLLGLSAAVVTGVAQGMTVGLGANPIITTLGAGAGLFGLVSLITGDSTVTFNTDTTSALGGSILGIPTVSYVFVLLTAVAFVILTKTRLGRSIVLVGANAAAATSAGIRAGRAVTGAFVLCALTAAMAGIFSASMFGEAGNQQFAGFTIDVVAAVLVSGISLRGGDGSPLRAALGAFFIALLINFAALHGYSYGVRLCMVGAAIVIGVTAHHLLKRARE